MARNTIEKRQAAASARQINALDAFQKIASELDAAHAEHVEVAKAATEQAEYHRSLADDSLAQAGKAKIAADNLRGLIGA